jgi:hypothetical protein
MARAPRRPFRFIARGFKQPDPMPQCAILVSECCDFSMRIFQRHARLL